MDEKKLEEAIEQFGDEVVEEVISIVEVSDPDGAYSHFDDYGMYDHMDVVRFLFFKF